MKRKKVEKVPQGWFTVRCIFAHQRTRLSTTYEERITIWRAISAEEAIRFAEKEARAYARSFIWRRTQTCRYVGFAESYELSSRQVGVGAEIFSLMRDSRLTRDRYLNRYFDSGKERRAPIRIRTQT
jgi:hypothetical protein